MENCRLMKKYKNLIRFVYFALRHPQIESAIHQHIVISSGAFQCPSTIHLPEVQAIILS